MEHKATIIIGECGEVLELSTAKVSSVDVEKHTSVLIELDGCIIDDHNCMSVILSSSDAKKMAKFLLKYADEAEVQNSK